MNHSRKMNYPSKIILLSLIIFMTACGGGTTGNFDSSTPKPAPDPSGNNAPALNGSPAAQIVEGQAYTFAPTASDADNDTLVFSISNLPSWASFDSATGALSGTPGVGDVGVYDNIQITVSDGSASTDLPAFSITVTEASNITGIFSFASVDYSVEEGNAAVLTVNRNTSSGEASVEYNTSGINAISVNRGGDDYLGVTGGKLVFLAGESSKTIEIQTLDNSSVESNETVEVLLSAPSENYGLGSASVATITIVDNDEPAVPQNQSPVISGNPLTSVTVSAAYSFTPTASDADGDNLTFSIANLPDWASFNTTTGALTGTPGESSAGLFEDITISVSDGSSTVSLSPFTVNVTQITSSSFTITASAGSGGSISPSGSLARAPGTNQTFTIAPNSGYEIANVLVDGKSVGSINTYTFSDIDTNHSISVTFSSNDDNETASSITMYSGDSEITWTFDKPYTIGYFVTGDPYVVDTGEGVIVTSVSPAQSSGRNGSQVNPSIGGSQPFDNRSRCGFNAGLRPSFPATLNSGDSLVSTVSVSSVDSEKEWNGRRTDDWTTVRSMAVLTVVNRTLPEGTFRPPYYGNNKPLTWNTSNVSTDWMPELSVSGVRLPNYSNRGFSNPMDYFIRGSERPWMVHLNNWCQREVAPHQNMFPYHQYNGFFISEASLLLTLDIANKNQLLYNLVQIGLDHYYLMGHGKEATSSFWKMPVLVSGLAFGNNTMLNAFKNGNYDVIPRDDEKFYDCTANLSGRGTSSWTGESVCFKKEPDEFYEEENPSTWNSTYCSANRDMRDCCLSEQYRAIQDSYPHIGMLLAAQILTDRGFNLKNYWNHDPAFTYMDRWMTENFAVSYFPQVAAACNSASWADDYYDSGGHPQDSPNFVDDMYNTYRN